MCVYIDSQVRRGHGNLQINDTTIYHCKKCKANLTKLWSPQLHTSDHLQEVIKDHARKHGCVHIDSHGEDVTIYKQMTL